MAPDVRERVSATLRRDGVNRTISDDVRQAICALRETGMIYEAIARQTGVSLAQAHRISKHIDVGPRRGRRRTEKVKGVEASR